MRKLKQELQKAQELNRQSEEEIQGFQRRLMEFQNDLAVSGERNKHSLQELSGKEEELVVFKVELSNLQEKFRAKVDEVRRYKMYHLRWIDVSIILHFH